MKNETELPEVTNLLSVNTDSSFRLLSLSCVGDALSLLGPSVWK
jgi:hypothetical protein